MNLAILNNKYVIVFVVAIIVGGGIGLFFGSRMVPPKTVVETKEVSKKEDVKLIAELRLKLQMAERGKKAEYINKDGEYHALTEWGRDITTDNDIKLDADIKSEIKDSSTKETNQSYFSIGGGFLWPDHTAHISPKVHILSGCHIGPAIGYQSKDSHIVYGISFDCR